MSKISCAKYRHDLSMYDSSFTTDPSRHNRARIASTTCCSSGSNSAPRVRSSISSPSTVRRRLPWSGHGSGYPARRLGSQSGPPFLGVVWKLMDDQQGAARIEMLIGTMHRLVVQIAAAADAKDSTHVGGAIRPVEAQLVEGLHERCAARGAGSCARAASIISAETSTPSTSKPSADRGTRNRPVPQPRSSTGSPNFRMADL